MARNRVPESRLADHPNCGRCHEPLFRGEPLPVDEQQFNKMIEGSDIPVVVDFWAEWCGPCKMFAPVYEQAAQSLEPGFRLLKLDTEANQAVAAGRRIQSIPTLAIFKGGQEVARKSGAMPLGAFTSWVTNAV
jgi:thioredoxin 2